MVGTGATVGPRVGGGGDGVAVGVGDLDGLAVADPEPFD